MENDLTHKQLFCCRPVFPWFGFLSALFGAGIDLAGFLHADGGVRVFDAVAGGFCLGVATMIALHWAVAYLSWIFV